MFPSLGKNQSEKNWGRELLNSDLKNCSLVKIWTKPESGGLGKFDHEWGFNSEFDHMGR